MDTQGGACVPHTPPRSANGLAYVDDIVLLADNESDLQILLDCVHDWCKKWHVLINVSKTKVMHFRHKNVTCTDAQLKLGKVEITKINEYKYLGVLLNCHLDVNTTVNALAAAGSRALGSVISKTKNNLELGYGAFTKLFHTLVCPVIDYGCMAWNVSNIGCRKLDQIQERALRYFCGLPRTCSIAGMTGEMGWIPGMVRRDVETIRLFNQIVQMQPTRLTRKIFEFDKSTSAPGSWSDNVKMLLKSVNMYDSWCNNMTVNLNLLRDRLMNGYNEAWLSEIAKQRKLRYYSTIKDRIEAEPYILANVNRQGRALVSTLRLGCLQILVETGRFYGIPRQQRICELCKTEVECEIHFLFNCKKTKHMSMQLYHKIPELLNYVDKVERFKFLCKKPHILSKYVTDLWSERGKLLCN